MKTMAPSLSPLLRSDAQGLMLAALYLSPEIEFSVTRLAQIGNVSIPTATREVERLESANFVTSRRVGPSRLVTVNKAHAIYAALSEIVVYAYGPVAVMTELLQGAEAIKSAHIYGSWAARLLGETGPEPNDIDVLLVGDVNNRFASEIGANATQKLGRPVNVHNLSELEWSKAESGFVKTIQSRPLVPLVLGE